LVQERQEQLWLVPFISDQWLEDGQSVSVRNAPTRFGPVSFNITSHTARGFIAAEIEPPTRRTPDAIVLRLRHPQSKRIRSVTVNGLRIRSFDPNEQTVTSLKPGPTPLKLRVEYY
jgi:hypothetical protein